jgi:KaiC/GvpD/RAD55 family RecA-like ATPase
VDNKREPDRPGKTDVLPSDVFEDASNVLLLGSPMDDRTLRTGVSLAAGDRPAEARVVWVTMLNSSHEILDIWDNHCSVRPGRLRIVLVGDGLADIDAVDDPDVETESLPDPTDLTTLGIKLTETVSAWTDDDVEIRLRFDSLTPLLQYVSARALARFLHVLTNKLAMADVTAHYHLDPMAHDSQTVYTLASICHARVEVDGDGVSVTHR